MEKFIRGNDREVVALAQFRNSAGPIPVKHRLIKKERQKSRREEREAKYAMGEG